MHNFTFSKEAIHSNIAYYNALVETSKKELQNNSAMQQAWVNLLAEYNDRAD